MLYHIFRNIFLSSRIQAQPTHINTHQHQLLLSSKTYLFAVSVEGHRHVEQDFALFNASYEILDPVLQLVCGLVDLLRITLASLSQLLCRLQEFVCICVGVLRNTCI